MPETVLRAERAYQQRRKIPPRGCRLILQLMTVRRATDGSAPRAKALFGRPRSTGPAPSPKIGDGENQKGGTSCGLDASTSPAKERYPTSSLPLVRLTALFHLQERIDLGIFDLFQKLPVVADQTAS